MNDEVLNQPPPLAGHDAFATDLALVEALRREGGAFAEGEVSALGRKAGDPAVQELARLANRNVPELCTHDRFGRRIDFVEYHPAYHALMTLAFGSGVHSFAWASSRPGGHVARAALSYLWNQIENGIGCPTGMAYASVPTLRKAPGLAERWEPKVVARGYDPRPIVMDDKPAVTIGMTLTEKQAGSDLRNVVTRAEPSGEVGAERAYRLSGHKWFCSAPMSDAFFTLAQTPRGPTFFFVPRTLPDGTRNPFRLERLKDKCGNRSNASAEIEFDGTFAISIGEEGGGVRLAIESAHFTRLDFAIGSAGLMRRAVAEALNHARHRAAFRRPLAELPLMTNVLADLALESEAAMALGLRVARAFDEATADPHAAAFQRAATPIAKYWACKRTPAAVEEALECLGGNGFVEEAPLARLYREAPLNNIWEGSANLICLDVLRAFGRDPQSREAVLDEIALGSGGDRRLDAAARRIEAMLARPADLESQARALVESLAVALQASLLVRFAPTPVAEAFCASRLDSGFGRAFGALPSGLDLAYVVARATPDVPEAPATSR